jgi:hypothetical protein
VVQQEVEFFFSPDMLSSDTYLRRHMDTQGNVPVWAVAQLGSLPQWGPAAFGLVRASLASSDLLVYDEATDLVRLKGDWQKWVFPRNGKDVPEEEALWGSQWYVFAGDDDEDDEDNENDDNDDDDDDDDDEEEDGHGDNNGNTNEPSPAAEAEPKQAKSAPVLKATATAFVPKAAAASTAAD